MQVNAKLSDIIEALEMQSEESRHFLNVKTGEVVNVSSEALLLAEEGEEYDHLPVWQHDEVKSAYDIVDNLEDYQDLPNRFDINEYHMMERFCYQQSEPKSQNQLLKAIQGKGAFRRFKDTAAYLGILDQWYDFKDACYKEIAIKFCEDLGVGWME